MDRRIKRGGRVIYIQKLRELRVEDVTKENIENFKDVYAKLSVINDERLRVEATWKIIGGK